MSEAIGISSDERPLAAPQTPVLTWRQRQILQVIRDSVHSRGYPPSTREIAEAVGLASDSSVSYQLLRLQRLGYLHRDERRPRTMGVRLPGRQAARPARPGEGRAGAWSGSDIASQEAAYVPLVGQIAPGVPVTAEQQVDGIFPLPRRLVGEGSLFMLKVAGDSMINAAIADGDWVVIRQQGTAENGDIIAAVINGEAVIKTYRRGYGRVWLVSHNPARPPVPGEEAAILGKVVAVIRRVGDPAEAGQ